MIPLSQQKIYDAIVIGAGHSGCEATLALSRSKFDTLLLTGNIDMIGAMSCNPAIGGIGKGHLVREIDALGGEMAKNIDETGIQFRKLNANKGPAVQGTRAQADKYLYKTRMRFVIESDPHVSIKQGIVKDILVKNGVTTGVRLTSGDVFFARSVIVTTGTFLRGLCHVGLKSFEGGRAGDQSSQDLSRSLIEDCGLELMRLKTGTVPRLDGKTINYTGLEAQFGDTPLPLFSFSQTSTRQRQISCHITYTNSETHDIIRGDLDKSPMFTGVIQGVGPRYCPSIEDKVVRFADKDRHQIFLEPEGLMTREVYPNGLSTSLPLETQIKFLRSIPGLENVEVMRPGYAVEYDAANPIQLKSNYETKNIKGLFLAGQINGTSGYEEAGAQGTMAGINAGQFLLNLEPVVLKRESSYIGVMTDDLVTKGVGGEPYRMFTSRAEYRLLLREDNADARLTPLARELGLIDDATFRNFEAKQNLLSQLREYGKSWIKPDHPFISAISQKIQKEVPNNMPIEQFFKWPEVRAEHVISSSELLDWSLDLSVPFFSEAIDYYLSDLKYSGYVTKYQRELKKMENFDKVKIPESINYDNVPSLSHEVRDKLKKHRPQSLSQALSIPGVTPTAVSQLEVFIATHFRG